MAPNRPQKEASQQISSPTTPSKSPGKGGPRTPSKGLALADRRREVVAGGTPNRIVSGSFIMGGGGIAPPPLVVESSRYEEWMKLSTDNKITSTNTWNLALIDYFADMSLLRNGDDNSINFQKASCTLDGCVKIWTSRVDSVATETGKLLSGLAEDGRSGGREDDEEDIEDGDDDAQEARAAKRKTARQASTLADNFSKIKVKSLELEFTVDPLFKKTSADFDEGGAGGILMNHLGCDGNMKVVFDAGDAKLENNEEEDEEDEEDDVGIKLDISKLKNAYLPSLEAFSTKLLCPSLASFRFSQDAVLSLDLINPIDEEIPRRPNAHLRNEDDEMTGDSGPGGDFGGGDDDIFAGQDFGGGGDEGEGMYGGNTDGADDFFASEEGVYGQNGGGGRGSGEMEDFDPRRSGGDERDLVMSVDGSGEQTFDYLDSALGNKNWAGPEHWKMSRKVIRKEDTAASGTKARKEKVPFSIDFSQPPTLTQKELFAPGGAATSLPRKSVTTFSSRRSSRPAVKEENWTLPADYQFNSASLLRLFLKPKTALRMRRRAAPVEGAEPEVHFWAEGAGSGEGGQDDMGGMGEFFRDDDDDGDGFVPFGTQAIFPDEDDEEVPYFSENEEGPDDIRTTTEGLNRARPEHVNHAKRAKRVDVKKLKDSIWSELEDVTIGVEEFPRDPSYIPIYPRGGDSTGAPAPSEALVPVISSLRKLYPADKMSEISTSFCFICLLHLANEKGLRIQTPAPVGDGSGDWELEEGMAPRMSVGGLDMLRVFREVNV